MRIQYLTLTLALLGGAMSPLAAAPASAAANVYATVSTAAIDMPTAGGAPVGILQLTVPAGSWLLSGKADPVNFGAPDIERCGILAGSTLADISASTAGTTAAVTNVKAQAAVKLSKTSLVTLFCQHDHSTSGEYVDTQASLIAQKVPGIVRQ